MQKANFSAVREASLRAQAPFKTLSMKELGPDYAGPPKYLTQRDAPLEIPIEVVRKLFMAMDLDMDDKISFEELTGYIQRQEVAIEPEVVEDMYKEACSKRPITHEHQRYAALTIEEIHQCVKGRYSQDPSSKEWGVAYRPFRDYWVLLLLTVNDRLFALQVPKVIPTKIKAQYEEQEEIAEMKQSLLRGEIDFARPEGIDKRYLTVQEQKQTAFVREADKNEAGIAPELGGTVVYRGEQQRAKAVDPFQQCVNSKVTKEAGEMPRFTFESKELYNQAQHLC